MDKFHNLSYQPMVSLPALIDGCFGIQPQKTLTTMYNAFHHFDASEQEHS
ncbi:MAG: hypothetical protein IPP49_20210 [Saprospiraceae bacterium]|nr:hypothetical protein [Saprospiraceae bacterium]